jgi:hypothetical protein
VALAVYAATLPPSLTWAHQGADGGDLAVALMRGTLPHPPGFPVYLLVGQVFARFPLGDPAWRFSLMSALFAAGAVALTSATARRAGANATASFIAGMSLACTPLFWSQAIIVEVYAVAAFFAALVIFLMAHHAPTWVRGLVLGFATGAHPILFFLLPMALWGQIGANQDRNATGSLRFSRLTAVDRIFAIAWQFLFAFCLFVIGWLAMYGGVVRLGYPALSPWGDVSTFAGWWSFVSGEMYRGFLFGLPLVELPSRLASFLALLIRQFTPVGALFALLGLNVLRHRSPDLALTSLLAFALVDVFAIGYNTTDSFVYLVVGLPLAALWLAVGLSCLIDRAERITRSARAVVPLVLVLLPLAQLYFFYGEMDLRADQTARRWAQATLAQAPEGAILLTERDAHTFALWYWHDGMQIRPDVIVVDQDLWAYAPYRLWMAPELGGVDDLTPEFAALRTGRPIVHVKE